MLELQPQLPAELCCARHTVAGDEILFVFGEVPRSFACVSCIPAELQLLRTLQSKQAVCLKHINPPTPCWTDPDKVITRNDELLRRQYLNQQGCD